MMSTWGRPNEVDLERFQNRQIEYLEYVRGTLERDAHSTSWETVFAS